MTDFDPRHDDGGDLSAEFSPLHAELLDALRFAEALERVEAGRPAGVDPLEDPALAALVRTAERVRADLGDATTGHSFHSFRTRSRAAVIHALEGGRVVPFYRRRLFAPFAAAAAAAAIVLAVLGAAVLPGNGGNHGAVATNLTPATTAEELDRLAVALADIQTRTRNGQSVPAPLLRAVSEGTARVANTIEQSPDQVSKETVTTYIQAAQNGQNVLNGLTVDQDAQGALAVAQRAARDGVVVAARFLSGATVTPTATGTPSGTATPAATGTPTGTATPGATATPTATETVTPTATAEAGSTPTASATPDDSDVVR